MPVVVAGIDLSQSKILMQKLTQPYKIARSVSVSHEHNEIAQIKQKFDNCVS